MLTPTAHTTISIPTYEFEDLRLRAPKMADFDAYFAFGQSPRAEHVGGPISEMAIRQNLDALAGHWNTCGFGRWIVADRDTDRALGVVGLYHPAHWPEPEIGWTVFDDAEGKSLAFRAAEFSRRYAYEVLGWTRIVSCIAAENTRSLALAKRMGATQDGVFEHPEYGPLQIWVHRGPEVAQ